MFRIDFNKLRFLICDDNPHMRRILRTLLHSFGAREVYEAEDGATALEMFTHYVPDIVITDWAMPIFDGLELAQMIRQPESKGNPYAPIIMLTGHSEKRRVTVGARRRRHRIPGQADLGQGALPAHPERGRQSAAVHQDQDLFRSRPPAQHQPTLYRPRAPQRRRSRRHAAAVAARQGAIQRLARLDLKETDHGQGKARRRSRSRPSPTTTSSRRPIRCARCCTRVAESDLDDPVARAEQALAGLSGEFKNWMAIECRPASAAHAASSRPRIYRRQARRAVSRRP